MIGFVEGPLENIDIDKITVNAGGLGYEIVVTSSVMRHLPQKGQKVRVLTYLNVKEDSMQLFGFSSKDEKSLFLQLLSVSGIGPKGAMNIVSSFDLNTLVAAIAKADVDFLTSVPGIGKKTAQRVVVELKEKISKAYSLEAETKLFAEKDQSPQQKDAVSALIALGYSAKDARQSVSSVMGKLPADPSIEEIIRHSLRNLSQDRAN